MERPTSERITPRRLTAVYLAAAWLLVGAPLAWGVYETFVKSLLLFR
ncbi:MAG: hypothetical protein RLZZ387_1775 [Chloroflexota bacterium]|jgi:hypothetical protein